MSKKYSSDTKMQKLFENFNKYINEDEMEDMEMEEEDAVVDSILDDVLGSIMMEGLDGAPNKEEIKSDIKKALKAPEVAPVLEKMGEIAKDRTNQDFAMGVRYALRSYKNDLMMSVAAVPGLAALGAFIGSEEPARAVIMDPAVVDAITSGNMKVGAAIGAAIGAAYLASVVVNFFKEADSIATNRQKNREKDPDMYSREDAAYDAATARQKVQEQQNKSVAKLERNRNIKISMSKL